MSRKKSRRQRFSTFDVGAREKNQRSVMSQVSKEKDKEANAQCMELIALLKSYLSTSPKDNPTSGYDLNSPAVTTHLTIVAEIINRLANNSNYCKTTSVAIATVFATFTTTPDWMSFIIWVIPIVAIAFLDSMFVYIKKRLTCEQEEFVSQFLSEGQKKMAKTLKEKFCLKSEGKRKDIDMLPFVASSASKSEMFWGMLKNLSDISVALFYGAIILTLVLVVLFSSLGLIEIPDSSNTIQIINEQTRF